MQYHQGPGFSLCSFFSAFYAFGIILRGSHRSPGLLLTVAKWQLKSKPHHPHTNSSGQEMVSFFLPTFLILNHVPTCSLHPSFTGLFQAHHICYSYFYQSTWVSMVHSSLFTWLTHTLISSPSVNLMTRSVPVICSQYIV